MIIFDALYTYPSIFYNNFTIQSSGATATSFIQFNASAAIPQSVTYPVAIPYSNYINTLFLNWGVSGGGNQLTMPNARTGMTPSVIVNSASRATVSKPTIINAGYSVLANTPDTPNALLPIALNLGSGWVLL